jgi:hypothetical protein
MARSKRRGKSGVNARLALPPLQAPTGDVWAILLAWVLPGDTADVAINLRRVQLF